MMSEEKQKVLSPPASDDSNKAKNDVDAAHEAYDDLPDLSMPKQNGFMRDMLDIIPPWAYEVMGLVLIAFAVLSLFALLGITGEIVAITWADILRDYFGLGSLIIPFVLFLGGIVMASSRLQFNISLPPRRILALELAILCVLALLHVSNSEEELRALARTGGGGGIVGWGLTVLPFWLLGRLGTILLFSALLGTSLMMLLGIQRQQIIETIIARGHKLLLYAEQVLPEATLNANDNNIGSSTPLETSPTAMPNTLPLMHIRADYSKVAPSLRPDAPKLDVGIRFSKDELESHPLFNSPKDELKIDYNIIGEKTGKKDPQGFEVIRRPDGREKRYFNVKAMKEAKKVGRRDKKLPELTIMADIEMEVPDEQEINRNVVLIENTLLEFDINIDVVNVQVGPTVTRYAIQPYRIKADGSTERTRLSKIASFHTDLSLALSAKRLRLEIPVPGTNYMGIEVPNKNPSTVALRSVYESKVYYEMAQKADAPLLVPLGRDVAGQPIGVNLAKMPHLLIAGTTGSGKSVAIAAIASSLIMDNAPDKVKLVMLDPKMVELSRFNGIPHLLGPVETDTDRIIGVLKWCTREMDRRYKLLEEHAVRNIDNYNEKFGSRRRGRDYMPYIVIMIDEIGDLMMSQPEETETAITRLAQMARAVGMHLVIATQRPSVDVITGLIKANFPGRIAFAVASGVDSRVILDSSGAENLLGRGDMLYLAPDAGAPARIQGCFVSDDEVRDIVKHWTNWREERLTSGKITEDDHAPWERGLTRREFLAETDPMLEDAIEFVVETQEASASILQRRLGLGYPRAARIVDMLYELGVVGESVGGGRARKVLIPKGEDPFKRIIEHRMKQEQETETAEED
jgi:hypothetical protein